MTRAITPPCRRDLACYRNDGHPGDHAYATPDTVPSPAPIWQAGYDAGYREAQRDVALGRPPREDEGDAAVTPRTKAGTYLYEGIALRGHEAKYARMVRAIEDEMLDKVAAAVGVAFIEAMRDMARTEALVIVEDRVLAAIEDIRKEAGR